MSKAAIVLHNRDKDCTFDCMRLYLKQICVWRQQPCGLTFAVLRTNWCLTSSPPSWAFSCSSLATSSSICNTQTMRSKLIGLKLPLCIYHNRQKTWTNYRLHTTWNMYKLHQMPTCATVIPRRECRDRIHVAGRKPTRPEQARTQNMTSMFIQQHRIYKKSWTIKVHECIMGRPLSSGIVQEPATATMVSRKTRSGRPRRWDRWGEEDWCRSRSSRVR